MATPRKSADQWFAEYGESHQDGTNELIHWICVPVIFFSVMGLLWSIPVPAVIAGPLPWFRWLHPLIVAALGFYFRLSAPLAFGLLAFVSVCYILIEGLVWVGWLPVWQVCCSCWPGSASSSATRSRARSRRSSRTWSSSS